MMSPYQYVLMLISILFLLSYVVYQRFLSPLSRIPGPFLASLTNWWLVYQTKTERYHRISVNLHKKYGPIVRTAPNQVSVSTPQAVRQVYPVSTTAWLKSDWYRVWRGPRKLDLFAGQDQKMHGQQRKWVARAYSTESLRDLEPYVDLCLKMLMEQFDKRIGQRVDMAKWVHLFAFGELRTFSSIYLHTATKFNAHLRFRCHWRNHMVHKLRVHQCRKGRWHIREHPNIGPLRVLARSCSLRLLCP